MALNIGLDIGGTFTDLIIFDEATGEVKHGKKFHNSKRPHRGHTQLFEETVRFSNMTLCRNFVHGTTVAINTVIDPKGAKTALVTTKGARDVYRIGRGNGPEAYNIFFKWPVPLVFRHMTFEAPERVLARGNVLTPLEDKDAEAVAHEVAKAEPDAVAVCFLIHISIQPMRLRWERPFKDFCPRPMLHFPIKF